MSNMKYIRNNITGRCPSCQRLAQFRFHGQQLTPPELWKEMGRMVNLYNCDSCGTTITERNIVQIGQQRNFKQIMCRRQLVRRYHGRDTYKWIPILRD